MIGYGLAYEIFKLLEHNGNKVVDDWSGELNMTYTYGGQLKDAKYKHETTINIGLSLNT